MPYLHALAFDRGVTTTTEQPPDTVREGSMPPLNAQDEAEGDVLTEYVVTRWYRPPEILAESRFYGAAADIWSVGCIFAEMLDKKREPIFRGSTPQKQMALIIAALGFPTEEELHFCEDRALLNVIRRICEKIQTDTHHKPWDFRERFQGNDEKGIDLLQKMLRFDPKKRITAEEALAHPFLEAVNSHWPKLPKANKFDFSFEKVHHDCTKDRVIPKKDLQNLFLYEVNKYRMVACKIPTPLHLKMGGRKSKKMGRATSSSSVLQSNLEDMNDALPVLKRQSSVSSSSSVGTSFCAMHNALVDCCRNEPCFVLLKINPPPPPTRLLYTGLYLSWR
jgi:serine/threonine protein kinase